MVTRGVIHYFQFDDPYYHQHPEEDNGNNLQLSQQEVSEHSSPKGSSGEENDEVEDDVESIDSFEGSQEQADMQATFRAGTKGILLRSSPQPLTQRTNDAIGALLGMNAAPPPIQETPQESIQRSQQANPQQMQHITPPPVTPRAFPATTNPPAVFQNPNLQQMPPLQNPPQLTTAATIVSPFRNSIPTTNKIFDLIQETGFSGLSEEEQNSIASCTHGANHEKYIRNQESLEKRFFDTLKDYGGMAMERLSAEY
jgi:hypothetical protein